MTCHVRIFLGATMLCLVAAPSWAAALRDHRGVNDGLIVAGIVTAIADNCPSLEVRKLRGFFYLNSLYNMARSAGFSHNEVEEYVDSEEEEARLRIHADAWLEERGVRPGDAESYCVVGRDQIGRGGRIGVFLRAE